MYKVEHTVPPDTYAILRTGLKPAFSATLRLGLIFWLMLSAIKFKSYG
jgi:hypothetical protein